MYVEQCYVKYCVVGGDQWQEYVQYLVQQWVGFFDEYFGELYCYGDYQDKIDGVQIFKFEWYQDIGLGEVGEY